MLHSCERRYGSLDSDAVPVMNESRTIIVGAGPAGVRAAETLVSNGVRPVVIDEAPKAGGQIYRQQPDGFKRTGEELYGFEADKAHGVHQTFRRIADKLDYLPSTAVWSVEGNNLWVRDPNGSPYQIPFSRIIVATGAVDRVMPFEGWTLPGIYTMGAAQIALKYQACHIGCKIALMGTGPLMYLLAYQYLKTGAEIVGIFDTTSVGCELSGMTGMRIMPKNLLKGWYYVAWLRLHGVPIYHGIEPVRASGTENVEALTIKRSNGREMTVLCDAIAFGYHVQAETQLADLLGCDFHFDTPSRQWLPSVDEMGRSSRPGIYLVGDGAKVRGADTAEAVGKLAAYACLKDMGRLIPEEKCRDLKSAVAKGGKFADAIRQTFPVPDHLLARVSDDTILCRCEEITAGEVRNACRDLDASEINRAKAFTRVGMGRCQGRMCGLSAMAVMAHALGVELADVGRMRGQAPIKPLTIGATLAGDRR